MFTVNSNDANKTLVDEILNKTIQVRAIANVKAGVILYEKGKGTPPQTEKTMQEKPFTVKEKQPIGWRPLVRGTDVNRYSLQDSDEFVKYGNWLAAPRDPAIFKGPVIMVRRTDDHIRATYVTGDAICVKSCHVLKPNDDKYIFFILAILNSKLAQWVFEVQNPQMVGKVFAEIKLVYLENLPIKLPNQIQIKAFDARVPQILAAKAADATADTSALEQEIDKLVYELYGLKDDEIALVEGRSGAATTTA